MTFLPYREMMPRASTVVLLAVLSGCGGASLLTDPPPRAERTTGNQENTVRLFQRQYRIDRSGRATLRTHTILQVGSEGTEKSLVVFDGSMMRLARYEARVVYADGSVQGYDKGDLASSTLSTGRVIADRSLRHASMKRVPGPGDVIETVSEHEITLPQLGVHFSPGEGGDRVLLASCVIEVPRGDTVWTFLANDRLLPSITQNETSTIYQFDWNDFHGAESRPRFLQRNDAPQLYAIIPTLGVHSWKEFGDWYLGVITAKLKADDAITAAAKGAVADTMSDTEKMFAIARYCQENIRYEQVYLEGGEVIPNVATLIFQHRYGDCKDYSTLMAVMARVVGLEPDLVLCRRGNGYAFYDRLPVDQFNHMLVHWQTQGKDFWFDGTNPPEAIGVPADDLINARALILKPGASSLATIDESPENLLSLTGSFAVIGDDLAGKVTIRLQGQYAVGFLEARRWENISAMKSILSRWVEHSVATRALVADILWKPEESTFTLEMNCRFSNAIWRVGNNEYIRFDKLFNNVLPQEDTELDSSTAFYYPGYARVEIDVTIPGFQSVAGDGDFHWKDKFVLPPGPFDKALQGAFIQVYRAEAEKAARPVPLKRKGLP